MSHTHQRGFTLIEMLTVIAISVIIMGILFANLRSFGNSARIDEDAAELATLIRSARQDSISVRENPNVANEYPSYGVFLTDAPTNPPNIPQQAFSYTDRDLTDGYRYWKDNPSGHFNTRVTEMQFATNVTITNIRFIPAGGGPAIEPTSISILFVRPDPIIYITGHVGANQERMLGSGTVEVTLTSSEGDVRKVTVNSNGHITTGY